MNKTTKAEAKKQANKLQKELTKLQEIIDAPGGGRWRAEKGNLYYFVDTDGDVLSSIDYFSPTDNLRFEIGSYYKTRAQAQAVVDLKKHIYKFQIPEDGEAYMLYHFGNYWELQMNEKFDNILQQLVDYNSGLILHLRASEQDREERLELLKKAYL